MTITDKTGAEVEQRVQDLTDLIIGQISSDGDVRHQARSIVEDNSEDYAITGLRTLFANYLYAAIDKPMSYAEGRMKPVSFMQSFTIKALDLIDWYQVLNYFAPRPQTQNLAEDFESFFASKKADHAPE